jgi:hypothetical protein
VTGPAPRLRMWSRARARTIANGKIVEIDILADPERLSQLDLAFLDD